MSWEDHVAGVHSRCTLACIKSRVRSVILVLVLANTGVLHGVLVSALDGEMVCNAGGNAVAESRIENMVSAGVGGCA